MERREGVTIRPHPQGAGEATLCRGWDERKGPCRTKGRRKRRDAEAEGQMLWAPFSSSSPIVKQEHLLGLQADSPGQRRLRVSGWESNCSTGAGELGSWRGREGKAGGDRPVLQAQGAGGPRMPQPEVLSTRASGRPSSGWRDLWLQRPCSHRPPSLSGWVRGVCKPPVAWPQLTPVSSVFSAMLFPSSPTASLPLGGRCPS